MNGKERASYLNWFLIAFSIVCLGLSLQPGKALWIDEFLHFAVGAYESTSEAWDIVRASIAGGINHGQTGAYMMVDYWLLRAFGANLFWLRFPSLLAGLLLYLAALHLFEQWNLPFGWRLWGCLALFSHPWLMGFVSEARPYMVLAATTLAALAYYTTPSQNRGHFSIRLLGSTGIIAGSLFHPYFLVYWFFVYLFTYFYNVREQKEGLGWREFVSHCDPLLSLLGLTAYFLLASLTWLPNMHRFDFDPFASLAHPFQGFMQAHFGFLWRWKALDTFLAVIGLTAIGIFLPAFRHTRKILIGPLKVLIGPLVFLIGTFTISAFLSYLSYRVNYWILPRQWVASTAFSAVGSAWLAYSLSTVLHRKLALIWSVLLFVFVIGNSAQQAKENISRLYAGHSNPKQTELGLTRASESPPSSNDEWVLLANLNCSTGGPVWPLFRQFYGKPN